MRRLLALFFSIFILAGGVMAQQMSDDQVVQYVSTGRTAGVLIVCFLSKNKVDIAVCRFRFA